MRAAKCALAEKAKADSSREAEEHLRFASAVFVDDSIAELVDEEVAAMIVKKAKVVRNWI